MTQRRNAMDNRDREVDVDVKPDAVEGSGSSNSSLDLSFTASLPHDTIPVPCRKSESCTPSDAREQQPSQGSSDPSARWAAKVSARHCRQAFVFAVWAVRILLWRARTYASSKAVSLVRWVFRQPVKQSASVVPCNKFDMDQFLEKMGPFVDSLINSPAPTNDNE